jgi:hypothetical protein
VPSKCRVDLCLKAIIVKLLITKTCQYIEMTYQQCAHPTLTNLRSIPLGDRWDGEIGIDKNTTRASDFQETM